MATFSCVVAAEAVAETRSAARRKRMGGECSWLWAIVGLRRVSIAAADEKAAELATFRRVQSCAPDRASG